MKQIRNLMKVLVIGGTALAGVRAATAQTVMQGTAKVIQVQGDAWYSLAGSAYQPLKLGTTVTAGSVIQTENASGAYVDIALFPSERGDQGQVGQSVVRITENSQLAIDNLTWSLVPAELAEEEVAYDIQLDLQHGTILGAVGDLSAASSFQVKLPNGLAAVSDETLFLMEDYSMKVDGIIDVLDGSVVVAYQSPNGVVTQVVSAGESFNPYSGQLEPIPSVEPASLLIKWVLTFVAQNAPRLHLYPGIIGDVDQIFTPPTPITPTPPDCDLDPDGPGCP